MELGFPGEAPWESLRWTNMTGADLLAVVNVSRAAHPLLPERPQVFAEKQRLFPQGAFVLKAGAAVVGYAFAHPWLANDMPALDSFVGAIPAMADCLFLHDVAVLPLARGRRSTVSLMELLEDVASANGLRRLALISVYGTSSMWRRFGFRERELPDGRDKLANYGDGACYMVRDL